jgi:class 3 adenylate cyclase
MLNEALLDAKLMELEQARPWSPRVISKLEAFIRTEDDYEVLRVNPHHFATTKNIAVPEAIDLFLYSAKIGLFQMEWHIVCAVCAHIVHNFQELADVHAHYHCKFCGLEADATLDDYIQVTFTILPSIRSIRYHDPQSLAIEDYYRKYHFCKDVTTFPGGYEHKDVLDMITQYMGFVEPHSSAKVDFDLPPGSWQAKDLKNGALAVFFVGDTPLPTPPYIPLRLENGEFHASDPTFTAQVVEFPIGRFRYDHFAQVPYGKFQVEFKNEMAGRSPVWVVHYPAEFQGALAQFAPILSAKQVLTTQTFRDLFRYAVIQGEEGLAIKDITFLFTDLKGSTELYDRIGDLNAYHLVRQHFETLTKAVCDHQGAIVKTIGDAIMAVFTQPQDAAATAFQMLTDIATFNQGISEDLILKVGIHRGHSIAVTLNDRLDYFGQSVNLAARIQGLAEASEICLSGATWDVISAQFPDKNPTLEEAHVKGIQAKLRIIRLK